MTDGIVIRQSFGSQDLASVRRLRYEILRKPLDLPPSGAVFEGDESESTMHILVCFGTSLIGCATLLFDDSTGIQLRGMAVSNDWQHRGIGSRIVETAEDIAHSQHQELWCNARFSAIGFYERQGWIRCGAFFEVPIIGQHIVMKWLGNSEIRD
jgi:GNAT superfamily N-acetyltransferase